MWWPFSWSVWCCFFPVSFWATFYEAWLNQVLWTWGRRVLPRSFAWWPSVARAQSATQSCVTMKLQVLGLFHASSRTGEHQQKYGNMPRFFRTFNLNTWKNKRSEDWMSLRLIICIIYIDYTLPLSHHLDLNIFELLFFLCSQKFFVFVLWWFFAKMRWSWTWAIQMQIQPHVSAHTYPLSHMYQVLLRCRTLSTLILEDWFDHGFHPFKINLTLRRSVVSGFFVEIWRCHEMPCFF